MTTFMLCNVTLRNICYVMLRYKQTICKPVLQTYAFCTVLEPGCAWAIHAWPGIDLLSMWSMLDFKIYMFSLNYLSWPTLNQTIITKLNQFLIPIPSTCINRPNLFINVRPWEITSSSQHYHFCFLYHGELAEFYQEKN